MIAGKKLISGLILISLLFASGVVFAATTISFTANMSEAVNITGTPRIAVDVGGVTRYATYASGTGTSALTFNYDMIAGDVDLDGVTISSPIDLNGGALKDLNGNDATLTFTVPNTSNIKVNYPSLGMDFTADSDGQYTLNGTVYNTLPSFLTATGGTFTRASIGTYFDSSGTLQTAASGSPRFDYDPVTLAAKGILIESSRTNNFKNSQFSGITTGTYTSNASLNNWSINMGGGQIQILSTGTQNGIPYLDIRFSYSNSSGSTKFLNFLPSSKMTISPGQITILSAWLGVTSYSSTGGTCSLKLSNRSYTSGGTYISESNSSFSSIVSYARQITPSLTHGGTAGTADGWLYVNVPNGVNCDLTARFGAPQMEIGSYATSYIPTTTAAVTRAADDLTIPTGSWYNASTSTLFTIFDSAQPSGSIFSAAAITLDDGTSNNAAVIRLAATKDSYLRTSNSNVANFSFGAYSTNTPIKSAMAFATNNVNTSYDGSISTTDTSATFPTYTTLRVGADRAGGNPANGHIQKTKYYPTRISDTQLQLMTQ